MAGGGAGHGAVSAGTGAELVIDALVAADVRHLFSLSGNQILPHAGPFTLSGSARSSSPSSTPARSW
jgi:hypothetical protein